jgi:hypothetical protein
VRIRGGKNSVVNLHFTQMNLEGDGNGICDEASVDASGQVSTTPCRPRSWAKVSLL